MGNNKNKTTNIIISLAGFLCCVAGYFIPAGMGILAEANVSLIQTLQSMDLILYCALPAVLAALSFLLVCIDKVPVLALITSPAGGAIIVFKAYVYAASGQAFPGLLAMVIGVILVITAALLSLVATDRGKPEGVHSVTEQSDESVYKASDIYMSDIAHNDSGNNVDDLLGLYEEETPEEPAVETVAESVNTEDRSIAAEQKKAQPVTTQSSVMTDFYAGIEDIFLDHENGGDQDE